MFYQHLQTVLEKKRKSEKKKFDELNEHLGQERNSREFQANEIDTLNNTNFNLELKCQELTSEIATKDLKLDELLAQLVEAKEQANIMEEMKHKVVTMLRYASGGKMYELLHDEKDDSGDTEEVKQARVLLSQFSASLRPSTVDKSKMIMESSSPEPMGRLEHVSEDDGKIRDTDTSSVSSGDDDFASQRVFELESWAEALEEDNRCMELALISLETDMLELESHRAYLEDVIHRALNQLIKPTPGEKQSERTPSSSQLVEYPGLLTDAQREDSNKMISITISKWLGDATYR